MKKLKKNKKYRHLNQTQRDRIQALIESDCRQKDIASVLGINKSTISREISRNRRKIRQAGGTINGCYEADIAQHKAYLRRYHAKFEWKKIDYDDNLKDYILRGLKNDWSPDEISGRMQREKQPFCASKTAIYEWLRTPRNRAYCQYLYSKRHRIKKRKSKTKKTLIPHRIGLALRPKGAINKTRFGHFEGDTVVSGRKTGSKSCLSVIHERKAKYLDIRKMSNLKPNSNNQAISSMTEDLNIKSLTLDNGIENTKHEELNIPTYFCDPYSAWQKGGIENAIKLIRRFIPKGADIGQYAPEDIKMIASTLNNKPRKSLNYKTPLEVMQEHQLLQENKKTTFEKVALGG